MKKIFNFSDFSALYEDNTGATGATAEVPKFYEQDLKKIISEMMAQYVYMTGYILPEDSYTDQMMDQDFDSIINEPILLDKLRAFENVINKIKQKSLETNKIKGAKELIDATVIVCNKYLEALGYLYNKYKDSPEVEAESASLIDFINKTVTGIREDLDKQAEVRESRFLNSGWNQIFEGKGKINKKLLDDVEDSISSLQTKVNPYAEDTDPKMKTVFSNTSLKLNKIYQDFIAMQKLKAKNLESDKINDLLNRINELGKDFDKETTTIIDDNNRAKKLESEQQEIINKLKVFRTEASDLIEAAVVLRNEYLKNKISSVEKIEYDPEKSRIPNSEAKKFQELVTNKFKNVKAITDLPGFKDMGTSGRFGPATAAMVKGLKKGYKLSDPSSSDITPELFAELNKEGVIKESRILSFSGFAGLNEGNEFDTQAAVDTIKSSYKPSYKKSLNKEKSSEVKASTTTDSPAAGATAEAGATGSAVVEDTATTENKIFGLLKDASNWIVNLFNETAFWKPYKGKVNDEEKKAAKAFEDEWHSLMDLNYLTEVDKLLKTLPDGTAKSFLTKSLEDLNKQKDIISNGITDKYSEDVYWTIRDSKGNRTSYHVDTDI